MFNRTPFYSNASEDSPISERSSGDGGSDTGATGHYATVKVKGCIYGSLRIPDGESEHEKTYEEEIVIEDEEYETSELYAKVDISKKKSRVVDSRIPVPKPRKYRNID